MEIEALLMNRLSWLAKLPVLFGGALITGRLKRGADRGDGLCALELVMVDLRGSY